jgi:hypothetical protein
MPTALLRTVALALGLVLLTATPAAADPAGPSDFRSEVTGILPATGSIHAEILGGDSFFELTVDAGHTVVVEGYSAEPYLRFQPDGTVERNRLSSATYLNDDRKAQVTIPEEVQEATRTGAEPEWEVVAEGGRYAWHDHRVHWMSDASPSVGRGERVPGAYDPWIVPLLVDGEPVEVQGTLTFARPVSPLPWVAVLAAVAGALAWSSRGRGLRLPAAALALVSAVAVVVGRAEWAATPEGAGNPLLWILAAIALVAALGAAARAARSSGVILALASVAALSAWGLLRISVLLKPVLPSDLPPALDRATVAAALGAALATAYLAVTSGMLALPDLDDD